MGELIMTMSTLEGLSEDADFGSLSPILDWNNQKVLRLLLILFEV